MEGGATICYQRPQDQLIVDVDAVTAATNS